MEQCQQTDLIIGMIKELKNDNKTEHCDLKSTIKGITDRQDITNGNIAKLKSRQLLLRGVLIGAGIVLFIFGFLPNRIMDLFKMAF